jgi:hypothetical protein
MSDKLSLLFEARHQDLVFELQHLANSRQLLDTIAPKLGVENEVGLLADSLESHLFEKLGVDLEEVAEDEEIELSEIDNSMKLYAIQEALGVTRSEYSSYLQFDRTIANLKSLGATEEEVEGLSGFKDRLEAVVFEKLDITDDDLKEDEPEKVELKEVTNE